VVWTLTTTHSANHNDNGALQVIWEKSINPILNDNGAT